MLCGKLHFLYFLKHICTVSGFHPLWSRHWRRPDDCILWEQQWNFYPYKHFIRSFLWSFPTVSAVRPRQWNQLLWSVTEMKLEFPALHVALFVAQGLVKETNEIVLPTGLREELQFVLQWRAALRQSQANIPLQTGDIEFASVQQCFVSARSHTMYIRQNQSYILHLNSTKHQNYLVTKMHSENTWTQNDTWHRLTDWFINVGRTFKESNVIKCIFWWNWSYSHMEFKESLYWHIWF